MVFRTFSLIILIAILICQAQVNHLTGQAEIKINLFSIDTKSGHKVPIDLYYSSSGILKSNYEPNGIYQDSWVGYGWNLSAPSICVLHNNTIDRSDDKWYLKSVNGVFEILRVWKSGSELFYIKGMPTWKIVAHFLPGAQGQMKRISGWELTDPNGIIYRYGGMETVNPLASRTIDATNNCIAWRLDEYDEKFIYQWDIAEIEDTKGGKIFYEWNEIDNSINNVTQEGYLSKIFNEKGDVIEFILDSKERSNNELMPSYLTTGKQFDLSETRYLKRVLFKNAGGTVLNEYELGYYNTTEFTNAYEQGFSKRLLNQLTSSGSEENNFKFEYYTDSEEFPGYLKKMQSATGMSKTYTYEKKEIKTDLNVVIGDLTKDESHMQFTTIIDTTNHIFVIDTTDNGSVKGTNFEILDLAGGRWDQWEYAAKLPGITYSAQTAGFDRFIPNTKCYPFGDRIVLLSEEGSNSKVQHLKIFEYVDGAGWKNTFNKDFDTEDNSLVLSRFEVQQTPGYVLLWEPSEMIIYVFQKIGGEWRSTFNSPSGAKSFPDAIREDYGHDGNNEGWNWPNTGFVASRTQKSMMFARNNFFMFTYRKSFTGESNPRVCVQFFKWSGNSNWENVSVNSSSSTAPDGNSEFANINGYSYKYSDVLMPVNPSAGTEYQENVIVRNDYYMIYRNPEGQNYCEFTERKYNPKHNWIDIVTGLTGPDPANTPQFDNVYPKQYVLKWPRRLKIYASDWTQIFIEKENNCWMMIYRMSSARLVYIAPTKFDFGPGNDPSISGSDHKFKYDMQCKYAKAFNRNDLKDVKSDENTIVVQFGEGDGNNVALWAFRWNEKIKKYESILNRYDADQQGQYVGTNLLNTKILFSSNTFGIVADEKEDDESTYRCAWIWKPDYINGTGYKKLDVSNSELNATLNDNGFISFDSKNSMKLSIKNFYNCEFEEFPQAVVTSLVAIDNGINNSSNVNYIFPESNQFLDLSTGIPYFPNCTEYNGDGSKTGKTVYNFSLDAKGLTFGYPIETGIYNTSSSNPVVLTTNEYEIHNYELDQYQLMRYTTLKKEIKRSLNVTTEKRYCNANGLPEWTFEKNSDGTGVAIQTIYARDKFSGLSEKNMLSQVCGTVTYKVPKNVTFNCNAVGEAIKADAVVWKEITSAGKTFWIPSENYVWNVPINADGTCKYQFESFKFEDPETSVKNDHWQKSKSVLNVNKYGQFIEQMDANGTVNTSILGTAHSVITGVISNARFSECGILTGDYDLNEQITYAPGVTTPSFDSQNSWEKAGAVLCDEKLWGNHSIKTVNCFGPTRNFKVYAGKDYIFSAWVKVKTGSAGQKLVLNGDYRHLFPGAKDILPYRLGNSAKSFGCNPVEIPAPASSAEEKWQFVSMRIPASKDVSGNDWYTRVFVGTPQETGGGTAYICDVRYYPVNSLAISTYYDEKWIKPVLILDANNNPSKKVTYDEKCRPISWQKIKLENGILHSTIIKTNLYNTMKSGFVTPKGENIPPQKPTNLSPADNSTITGQNVTFTWSCPNLDADGQNVTFGIYQEGKGLITSGLSENTYTVNDMKPGNYNWYVVASDGKETVLSDPSNFQLLPAGGFSLFNLDGNPVMLIPIGLFNEIKNTLSSASKKTEFENTYSGNDGVNRIHSMCQTSDGGSCDGLDAVYGGNFLYRVYHEYSKEWEYGNTGYKKWTSGWVYKSVHWTVPRCVAPCTPGQPYISVGNSNFDEGQEAGYTGMSGSVKLKRMQLLQANSSLFYPDITLSLHFDKSFGSFWRTGTWGTEMRTRDDDNSVIQMNLKSSTPNIHTWYRVWRRGRSWTGWITDGNDAGDTDTRVDKVQIYIFNYEK